MSTPTIPDENLHIDVDNIRSAGGILDGVWVGKLGAVMPQAIEDPTEHDNVGWLGDDGITFAHNDDEETFTGHQGAKVVRKKITSSEDTFQFVALESTALTYGLIHDISSRTTTNGVTRMKVTGAKKSNDKRSWIVDLWDGDIWERYLIPSGEIGERPEVTASNSGLKQYEFTVTVYGGYEILTNDPAQVAAAEDAGTGDEDNGEG